MNRYVECHVRKAKKDDGWMVARDHETGETFLIGLCSRELQLIILAALNAYRPATRSRAPPRRRK